MITQQDILDWVQTHATERAKTGFPEEVNNISIAYALGLYEGYYSGLMDAKANVEQPDESQHDVKEI